MLLVSIFDSNLLLKMVLKTSFRFLFSRLGGLCFGGFIIAILFLGDPQLGNMMVSSGEGTSGTKLPLPSRESSSLPSISSASSSWIQEAYGTQLGRYLLWPQTRGSGSKKKRVSFKIRGGGMMTYQLPLNLF